MTQWPSATALDKREYKENIFSYLSTKKYIVGIR